MASTSTERDFWGNPIDPEGETSGGKTLVVWSEVIPDDIEVDDDDEQDQKEDSDDNEEIESDLDEESDGEDSVNNSEEDGEKSSNSEEDMLNEPILYSRVNRMKIGDEGGGSFCICMQPIDIMSSLNLMNEMSDYMVDMDTHGCMISNAVRSINKVMSDSKKIIDPKKIAVTDLFFRLRHEILFKLVCRSYNLPEVKSDTPFSAYGIDSKRTPDLIIEVKGTLVVIEVTASSSYERAAQSKGVEKAGFESKYKKEIDLLNDRGTSCIYLPIIFNMSETSSSFDHSQFNFMNDNFVKNKQYYNLMLTVSKNFAIISNEMKVNMAVSASILFQNTVEIKMNHSQHSFLYNISSKTLPTSNKYNEINVSSQVYNKVCTNWSRFYDIMDNSNITGDCKFCFCINTNSHRFQIEKDESGLTEKEYTRILDEEDKLEFFKNLNLIIGGVRMKATESNTGIKFYEKKTDNRMDLIRYQEMRVFVEHNPSPYSNVNFDMLKYNTMARKSIDYNLISNHYDPGYEDKLINAICKMDRGMDYIADKNTFGKCLGNSEAFNINIDSHMAEIEKNYIEKNMKKDLLPVVILKMKNPFILPISEIYERDYCGLDFKPVEVIVEAIKCISESNPFTTKILENVLLPGFNLYSKPKVASLNLRKLIQNRIEVSNNINVLQKEIYKKGSSDNVVRLSKTNDLNYKARFEELRGQMRSLNREIKSRQSLEGVKNETTFIRLPTKGKGSSLRGMYELEMAHFKDKKKQSTIEGVGIRTTLEGDFKFDSGVFENINESLMANHGENPDQLLDFSTTKDAKLLTDLKNIALEQYKTIVKQVKNSGLGHSCSLISRMAHSLLYYSQLPFNSEYVRVDNLGYKNVLLIVKGGKKIFRSKGSKLYRLIYPIERSVLPWLTIGHSQQSSTTLFNIGERTYAITPWQIMHESILCESISFYPRVCSFVVLNSNPDIDLKQQYHRVTMNVMLAFHNRRQTETLLANLRYILLSTLGDFTGITEILPEFFGFNYDCFQAFVRGCVLYNYPNYFKQLGELKGQKFTESKDINLGDFMHVRLKNIFNGVPLKTTEDLALMIYSTFLMTKAPYQRSVERANNLKGILKIHELYETTIGKGLDPIDQLDKITVSLEGDDYIGYYEKLFSNDFNIDPKYCALVGNFVDSIYINQGDAEDLHASWIRIINKTWDELSTSTGLRGDYEDLESFWGKKGYFVVYKGLLEDPSFREKANTLFFSDVSDDQKRKIMKDINITYYEKINPEREFLIFHAVDKVQWRGGREIYVMDLLTKTMQQPIEQYMAELCKKLDNELISIPSDKRSQVIHHSIFEKDLPMKNLLTWYLTLDCTKWAPKSVFVKFAITLLNMHCIPTSFKVHFLNYIEKLYNKRVYFNKQEVEVLKNNNKYKKICSDYLIYDEKLKGYYMEMQYSWVMGIFNYTSSFLHAANQKYFSYILMKSSLISYKEESTMVMFAHSDDSGGRLTVSSYPMAKRALILYEINLKACNHLLSRKKSVVSRIYFEILSIIYLFRQLLALLPKFLGGLRFMPTDKGPAQDMLQSYSKCIEVMVAGANFSVAYMVMKFYSMMIWRFYYNRPVCNEDYERPVQYLGMPDAHPLLVLLCGSDAELLRLLKEKDKLCSLMSFVQAMLSTTRESGPIKPIQFEIKVKGIGKGFESGLEEFGPLLEKWSVRNVNYHNSIFNLLSFLSKLNDSGFVGSLVNESTTRRLSRCYYMRSGDSCVTRLGNIKLSKVVDSLTLLQGFSSKNEGVLMVLEELLSEGSISKINEEMEINITKVTSQLEILEKTLYSPIKINEYLDNLTMENRKITPSTRTLKPTVLQLTKTAKVFSTDFDPATLVSYIKEPEFNWAINDQRGLVTASIEVEQFCQGIGLDINSIDSDDLLRICRTYGRENTKMIYLYSRVPSELRHIKSFSAFLSFLSVNTMENKEISGLTLKLSGRDAVRDYVETNVNDSIYLLNNIISALNVFIQKTGPDFLLNCKIKPIIDINWIGGSISNFLKKLESEMEDDVHFSIIKVQLKYIMHKLGLVEGCATEFNGGAYYTFLKSQKVKGGWYGKGEMLISIENNFYSFTIMNTEVESVQTNRVGKLPSHHTDFLKDVFNATNLNYNSIIKGKKIKTFHKKMFFGVDNIGGLSVLNDREMSCGVPCIVTENRGGFIDEMHLYKMDSMVKDHLIIKNNVFEIDQKKKIYFLPIKKAEIVPVINQIFYKEDFEEKMMQEGLSDFEDYVLTEIMTEYGTNNYIGFEEFIDGFTGSEIYKIFKKCREDSMSEIPKKLSNSIVPAQQGSLTRIFIDYTNKTGDRIIETPKNLDPVMMQLRSEYPEQMSVILSENLINCHQKIYSLREAKEISDSYSKLYEGENIEEVRGNMIKLLTFWGYGALVNSIEKFTFTRDNKNFIYFNRNICNPEYINHYEGLFPRLVSCINMKMLEWNSGFRGIEPPYKSFVSKLDNVYGIIRDYVINSCFHIYNYRCFEVRGDIYTIRYYNMFLGFLKDEDFVADLQNEVGKHYILSSIPLNYQNRKSILLLLNNLKDCWLKANKESLIPQFCEKLQRIPDNIRNYRSLIKQFGINIPPSEVYYHGFLNLEIINNIKESVEISVNKTIYRVTSKISKLSDTQVSPNSVILFKYPLRSSVVDSEEFEEFNDEVSVDDIDVETAKEIWESIKNPYKPKITKTMNVKGNRLVRGCFHWIINPYNTCIFGDLDRIRQVGENIIYLTNSFNKNFKEMFPNGGVRIVRYDNKVMLAHYTMTEDFKKGFIERYVGGEDLIIPNGLYDDLMLGKLRDVDGEVKNSTCQGSLKVIEEANEGQDFEEKDGIVVPKIREVREEAEEEGDRAKKDPLEVNYNSIMEKISELKKKGLSDGCIKKLKEKYFIKAVKNKVPYSVILSSLVREGELNLLNEMIKNNTIELTNQQQQKAFLSPEYFGLAYGMNRMSDPKSIKNSKVRAELESIHKDITSGIGSCTLDISKGFKKTLSSNLQLWKNAIKNTKCKRENKMFLYTLILGIANTARVGDSIGDDHIWQDLINKSTNYIAEEEVEEDDSEFLDMMFNFINSTRLRYRPEGM